MACVIRYLTPLADAIEEPLPFQPLPSLAGRPEEVGVRDGELLALRDRRLRVEADPEAALAIGLHRVSAVVPARMREEGEGGKEGSAAPLADVKRVHAEQAEAAGGQVRGNVGRKKLFESANNCCALI